MKYQPFAYWIFALIAGILLQKNLSFTSEILNYAFILAVFLVIFLSFYKALRLFFIFAAIIFFFVSGALRFEQHHRPISELPENSIQKEIIQLRITERLKSTVRYQKYIAQPKTTQNQLNNNQKLLLYVKLSQPELHVNDVFWTQGYINRITAPGNPHQFDYQNYMMNRNVGLQIFTDTIVQLKCPTGINWNHSLSKFKLKMKEELLKQGFSQESRIFISSLAIGDRSDLNADYQEKLSSAGVMHLFAISGLHVGIVFGFLMLLLYPVLFIKKGKYIRILIALIVIWIYAWFVGFTPSVTRAAFMISVYYSTLLMQRPANLMHTLAVSAFILLLINPKQLFDVGFQLSYSAVFFIGWLFRDLRSFFPFHRKPWRNYPYDLLCVTTIAQMGVMPVSVYYFNTFSGLFLLGNMILLPFAGLLVIISMMSVALLAGNLMPVWLVSTLNKAFDWVFYYIDLITSFKSFIFKGITWNWVQVAILLIILIGSRNVLRKFRVYKLIPLFGLFLLFQMTKLMDSFKFNNKRELIVFQDYKGSILGFRDGLHLDIFMQVEDSAKSLDFNVIPYTFHEKLKSLKVFDLNDSHSTHFYTKDHNTFKFNNQLYTIISGNPDSIPNSDYIILHKISHQFKVPRHIPNIIADGSNYPYIIQSIQEDAVNLHYTATDGAFLQVVE